MPAKKQTLKQQQKQLQQDMEDFNELQETDIYFKRWDKDELVQMPVLPEKLTYKREGNIQEVDLLNVGTTYIPRKPGALEISFESFWPVTREKNLTLVRTKDNFKKVGYYSNFFRNAMNAKVPLWFVVTGVTHMIEPVLVDNLETWVEGGSGSRHYSIVLRRYTPEDTTSTKITTNKKGLAIGDFVHLSGKVYQECTSKEPKKKNYKKVLCKINLIKKKQPNPYHLVDQNNKPIGWAKKGAIKKQ